MKVVYFEKKPKARPTAPRFTQTIPELPVFDDVVTVSEGEPLPREKTREKSAARRRTLSKEMALPESTAAQVATRTRTPQEVADLAVLGHQLFEAGRLQESKVIFEGLVATGSREAFPFAMLGTIYLALEETGKALEHFESALKIDRDDLASLVYRGEIRLAKGKFKSAMEDLKHAIGLAGDGDPFVERARRLLKLARSKARQ